MKSSPIFVVQSVVMLAVLFLSSVFHITHADASVSSSTTFFDPIVDSMLSRYQVIEQSKTSWTIHGTAISTTRDTKTSHSHSLTTPFITVLRVPKPKQFYYNHTCFNVTYLVNETTFCYPLVTVGGFAKCGTTSVYKLFTANRKAFAPPNTKERCNLLYLHLRSNGTPIRQDDIQALWEYFYFLGNQDIIAHHRRRKFTVSGCLQGEVFQLMLRLLRNPRTNVILTVRDYAERAYSVYKFFCSSHIDPVCSYLNDYHNNVYDVRSPSKFHNMIKHLNSKSSELGTEYHSEVRQESESVPKMHHLTAEDWQTRSSFYQDKVRLYTTALQGFKPNQNVLVLAMESLEKNPRRFWNKIARDFLNLKPQKHYTYKAVEKAALIHSNKYSTNDSSMISMLPETREILDREWFSDCLWTSRMTGFRYLACHPD